MNNISRRQFFSILTGAGVSLSIPSALARSVNYYKYVVAADPQLWWQKKDDNKAWLRAIKYVNDLKPDFIIVCGDLICLPNDPKMINWERAEKMADSYMEGVRLLDEKIPIYHVAGNHDVGNFPTKDTLKWYQERFSKLWYSFVHKNSLFVVIESNSLINSKGITKVYKEQLEWLQKVLTNSRKKAYDHRTVYMHHPLFVREPDEEHTYHNMPVNVRHKLLGMFVENNVEIVFSGHLHANMYAKYKGMELITTESACHSDDKGLRIVDVKGDKIYDKFVKL